MANPPASASLAGVIVLLLLSLALLLQADQGATAGLAGGGARRTRPSSSSLESYMPVRTVLYRSAALAATATAQAYEPFELCMGCRCCSAAAGSSSSGNGSSSCVDMRCCYAIDCSIPGKPFGVCAFSPRTCGCGATNNCTKPA